MDGLLQGNLWQIGSPFSCQEVIATKPDSEDLHDPFQGMYCLIQPLRGVMPNGTLEEGFPGVKQGQLPGEENLRSPPLLLPGNPIFDVSGVSTNCYVMFFWCLPQFQCLYTT